MTFFPRWKKHNLPGANCVSIVEKNNNISILDQRFCQMTSYRFWDMYICYKLNHVIGDNITLQIYIALYLKTQFKASEYITYLSDIYLELNWFVFCYSIAKEWTWVNVFYEMIGYCLNFYLSFNWIINY